MPSISIHTPGGKRTVPLDSGRITLGRSTAADLCYPDDVELSRLHLVFERAGDGFSVRDLSSKNGTIVNGARTSGARVLQPDDRISCGLLTIVYDPPMSGSRVEFIDDDAERTSLNTIVTSLDRAIDEPDQNAGRTSQLSALIKAANELASERPLLELFRFILDLSMDAAGAGRGVLLMIERGQLVEQAIRGDGLKISAAVRDRVVRENLSVLVQDATLDTVFKERESIIASNVRTLMAAPLQVRNRVIGLIYLDSPSFPREFTRDDLNLLTMMANVAAIRVEHARLAEVEQARKMMERDLEHAEAANRAKSAFLANMNHELRTPLTAILGFTRLLTRKPLPRDVQEDLRIIQENGNHLLMLINHVLDLAKIESGQATLREIPTDLYRLLGDLEQTFAVQAEEIGLQLLFERARNVPRLIQIDQLRLREVLFNLLGNALKFTSQGSVNLRVTEAGSVSEGRCRLRFELTDTGMGISPEELNTVFDAFVQSRTGRELRQGTGLGLTISSNYVRLMGGELRLESEAGRGTTALFEIPARLAEDEPAAEIRRPIAVVSPGGCVYRILVADDGWAMRRLIQRLLTPLGFEVHEACDGSEALEVWKQWRPHLICMDLQMPLMDGFEATRRIKAQPGSESTIIVAVSASSFEEPRAAALEAGCDGFLRKPFDEADLLDLLRQYLGVEFAYAKDEPASAGSGGPAAERRAIASLPAPLRAMLYSALVQLDVAEVQRALDEIGEIDRDAADTLRGSAANYRYGRLLRLIDNLESE
jgi:signal transduction histidine kinase/ActR/RegA family two-component response regulator